MPQSRLVPAVATICVLYTFLGSIMYAFQYQGLPARWGLASSLLGAPPEVTARFQDDLWTTVPSLILCILSAAVAPASGVGGGSFFVAVFVSIMGWGVQASVALSQATMSAAAVSGAIASGFQSNPEDPSRPVVDYDLGLVLSPGMLIGSSMGVLLAAIMPTWLTSFMLVIVLAYITYNGAGKASQAFHQEQEELKEGEGPEQGASASQSDRPHEPLLSKKHGRSFWANYKSLFAIIAFWAVFMALEVHKREDDRCNKQYAILTSSQVVIGLIVLGASVWFVSRDQQQMAQQEGTAHQAWTTADYAKIGVISLIGGILAGLLGMGGGFILTPLMLTLGVHPSVSATTSNLVLVFSTSFAALGYERMDLLNYQFAAIFPGACLISGGIGVVGISRLVQKSGHPSILVVLMVILSAAATVLTGIFKGGSAFKDLANGHNIGFKPFCQ